MMSMLKSTRAELHRRIAGRSKPTSGDRRRAARDGRPLHAEGYLPDAAVYWLRAGELAAGATRTWRRSPTAARTRHAGYPGRR